jgi:hypothetical protein
LARCCLFPRGLEAQLQAVDPDLEGWRRGHERGWGQEREGKNIHIIRWSLPFAKRRAGLLDTTASATD